MTTEQLLRDYTGPSPDAYAAGFADAGRNGIRGEWTSFPEEQRDAYAAGVVKASEDRSLAAFPSPWMGAVEDDDNGSLKDSEAHDVVDDGGNDTPDMV